MRTRLVVPAAVRAVVRAVHVRPTGAAVLLMGVRVLAAQVVVAMAALVTAVMVARAANNIWLK